MPPRPPAPRLAATALAAAVLAAGCGGSARVGRSFTLTLDDFLIRPQSVEVPAGRVTLTVVNRGAAGHNLRIQRGDHTVFSLLTLKPGVRTTQTFRLKRGHYRMVDTIPQHEILGTYGTLVVR